MVCLYTLQKGTVCTCSQLKFLLGMIFGFFVNILFLISFNRSLRSFRNLLRSGRAWSHKTAHHFNTSWHKQINDGFYFYMYCIALLWFSFSFPFGFILFSVFLLFLTHSTLTETGSEIEVGMTDLKIGKKLFPT
jgi:hypothetical protein